MAFHLLSYFYSVKTHIHLSYLWQHSAHLRRRTQTLAFLCLNSYSPFTGRNKGKPLVKHNASLSKHQKNHTQNVRIPCTKDSLEAHVAWKHPDLAQHRARGNSSRAVSRCTRMQAWKIQSHLSKQSTRVYYQTDGKLSPSPNPKSLNSLWDMNNLKALPSRG